MQSGRLFIVILIFAAWTLGNIPGAAQERRNWGDEFAAADSDIIQLYQVIDQALETEEIPPDFLSNVLNTDIYSEQFSTYCVFRVFQLRTAMKMSERASKEVCAVLRQFYYEGDRSRILRRPVEYQLYSNYSGWREPISEVTDTAGISCALVNIPWYGCDNDLWLIKGKKGGKTWKGPWFTGLQSKTVPGILALRDNTVEEPAYTLRIEGGEIYIRSLDGTYDKPSSPEVLTADYDDDGLYDVEERRFGTDPENNDTDGDGLFDGIDINPLTVEKKELLPEDYARMAVFMWETMRGIHMHVYYVDVPIEDSLEFRAPSPNALVLPVNSTQVVSDDFDCRTRGVFGQMVSVGISPKDDSTMIASLRSGSQMTSFLIRRLFGVWIIAEERETIQY